MSIVEPLVAEAIRLGAPVLEVEYKDRKEIVFAMVGSVGHGIAQFPSDRPEGRQLREELAKLARRKKHVAVIGDRSYELRCGVYDSFGEDACRVTIKPIPSR